jgi:hypothetical protein
MTTPKKPPRQPTGVPTAGMEMPTPILTADELLLIKAYRTTDGRGRSSIFGQALYQAKEWPQRPPRSLRLVHGGAA